MSIIKAKKSITLLVGIMAITALGSIAQAETRLAVQDSAGTTDKMVVTDTGAVGIGTNAPGAAIEINGLPGNTNSRIIMRTIGKSSAGGGGILSFHNNDSLTNGSLPVAGDRLGFYFFGSKNGAASLGGAGINGVAEANWTAGASYPTYFSFLTVAPGSTAQIERLRIAAGGNIGMGTNVPKHQLEVNGGIRLNNAIVSGIKAALTAKPACDNTSGPTTDGGVLWFTKGATGVKDSLEVCAKDSTGTYAWRTLY